MSEIENKAETTKKNTLKEKLLYIKNFIKENTTFCLLIGSSVTVSAYFFVYQYDKGFLNYFNIHSSNIDFNLAHRIYDIAFYIIMTICIPAFGYIKNKKQKRWILTSLALSVISLVLINTSNITFKYIFICLMFNILVDLVLFLVRFVRCVMEKCFNGSNKNLEKKADNILGFISIAALLVIYPSLLIFGGYKMGYEKAQEKKNFGIIEKQPLAIDDPKLAIVYETADKYICRTIY